MATSNYSYGSHGLFFTSPMNDSSPHVPSTQSQFAQTSSSEAVQLPTLHHSFSEPILTTLSDSRPPTSQEEDDLDFEDIQTGEISLVEAGQNFDTPSYGTMAGLDINDHDSVLAEGVQIAGSSHSYTVSLNHHVAALEDFIMAHPIPSLPPSTPSIPVQLPPLFSLDSNLYELDQESESADGDHANLQDTTAFLDVSTFFRHYLRRPRGDISLYLEELHQPDVITKSDLDDNEYDIQGINWNLLNMTREDVRMKRSIFEATRMRAKVKARRQWSKLMPNTANLFSFRRMNTTHRVDIPHFQLRNLLVSTSRSDIYYATGDQVLRTDALGASADCIMDLTRARSEGHKFLITTLNALDDVLIAGGFYGEYALTNLSSTYGTRSTVGRVASANNGITNQVHIFNSRSNYTPQAAFCSNDKRLRILDCETNAFTHSFLYSNPVNCSATSPNGRMRVVVGDFHETLITNAETGQAFETLRAHDDDVFACAWADDGIHVATSAQDCRIAVWDARNWSHPLSVIESELSIPRCLRFSPVGSGPRVLISAEADDYVNVIDAVNFDTRHVLDFFGRTAGISMTPDGSSLFVANSDPNFGGIMEFERCQFGEQYGRSQMSRWGSESYEQSFLGGEPPFDWAVDEDMDDDVRVVCGWHERQRRGLELGSLVV